jgi:hypothetical protein
MTLEIQVQQQRGGNGGQPEHETERWKGQAEEMQVRNHAGVW